jgi:hypothetical protein
MRVLTRSEATVVWLLLARSSPRTGPVPGIEMPHRRTLQSIRQRAYQREWLRDRFVPSPEVFGLDRVTLAITRPPIDRIGPVVRRWQARPENVVLWATDDQVFGVFLSKGVGDSGISGWLGEDGEGEVVHLLDAELRPDRVPVYFDFEMAWVRAAGLAGVSEACPRSFPAPPASSDQRIDHRPLASQRTEIRGLVDRYGGGAGLPPSVGSWLGRRFEERCYRLGWAAFRTFLNPMAIASSVTGFPGWCAFVRGRLRSQAQASRLFSALVGSAGVSPFLYATDGAEVWFAALSMGPGTRRGTEHAPVLATLQAHLEQISVDQWPLLASRVINDHRYGPCLDAAQGGHGAPPTRRRDGGAPR